jgi:hypothetical protein
MSDDDEVESARQEHEDLCWLDHAERLVSRTLDELAEGESTRWEEWLSDHAGCNQESQESQER